MKFNQLIFNVLFQFDKLESCQNITLAINLKVDRKKGTSPGKTSQTSTFVAAEYYWGDESLNGAAKTERTRSSFEFYAPSKLIISDDGIYVFLTKA